MRIALLVPLVFSLIPFLLPDRPPLAHTGGFGEPTCQACHFGNPLDDSAGRVTITGLPSRFTPDSTYAITIELARPGMLRAGFQLAARYVAGRDSGRQAGRLEPVDGRTGLSDTTWAGFGNVLYAWHTGAGSALWTPDVGRWTMKWTAPAKPTGAVVFHATGNAANDDDSPLGDFIYATKVVTK